MRPTLSTLVRMSLLAEATSEAPSPTLRPFPGSLRPFPGSLRPSSEPLRPYPGGAMPYEEDRAAEEAGEYFQNEAALRALGRDAWEDEAALAEEIMGASPSPIAREELRVLQNTDADAVLQGEWERVRDEIGRERDVESVEALLSSGRPVRPPIVVSYPGGLGLLGGNTRLCVGVSMGFHLPVVRLSVS